MVAKNEAENTSADNPKSTGNGNGTTRQVMALPKLDTVKVLKLHAILKGEGQGELAGKILDEWAAAHPVTVSEG